jgi:hypothetical protein
LITVADLKEGDKVGVCSGGWKSRCELKTVARKTATQIVLDDGTRWTKYGRRHGEGYSYHSSYLVTEADARDLIVEWQAKRERAALLREIRDANYVAMPTTALREIADAVKLHTPQVESGK